MHGFQNIVIGLFYVAIPAAIGYVVYGIRGRFKKHGTFPPHDAASVVMAIGLVAYFVLSCSLHHVAEGIGTTDRLIVLLHWHEVLAASACLGYLVWKRKELVEQGFKLVVAQRYVRVGEVLDALGAGYGEWPEPGKIEWDAEAARMHGFDAAGTFMYADWLKSVRDDEEIELAQHVAVPMLDGRAPYVHTTRMKNGKRVLAMFVNDGMPRGILVEVPDGARAPIGGGSTLENLVALRNAARKL